MGGDYGGMGEMPQKFQLGVKVSHILQNFVRKVVKDHANFKEES
jgi:hypothetical protein